MTEIPVKRRFIDISHGQLHLREAGRPGVKPAVVCLHMVPKSGRSFAKLMPELATDRLVVAPDLPGYGESSPVAARAPEIDDYVISIEELVAQMNLTRIDLVGYHTGAMIAVALAHRHPSLVRKVINLSAPIFSAAEVAEFSQYFAPIALDEAGTRFKVMWERIIKFRGPGMTLEMAATSLAENLRGGERYEEGHQAAFDFTERYVELVEQIEQPLLVMNLGDDLYQHTKRIKSHTNNGRLVDCPDWGHGCLDIWPTEVAALMLEFLDDD